MRILLVDGHQKTNFLIKTLKAKHNEIVLINNDREFCERMQSVHEIVCVHGDGTKPFVLQDAEIESMDIVIALSSLDSANLVVCELAKKLFKVDNTLAVVNDPKNVALFKELGVSKCVSATKMITEIIESEAIFDDITEYLPLENGKIVAVEIKITTKSPVIGKRIMEIKLPQQCILGCILRNELTIIPKGNTKIELHDKIILLSTPEVADEASEMLTGVKP